MQWHELYNDKNKPVDNQIIEFVKSPLLTDLDSYLKQQYNVLPQLFYSACSMDNGFWKGWNVKYKKMENHCARYIQS